MLLHLTLPKPPGFNDSYRAKSAGRKAWLYKTTAATSWQEDAATKIKAAAAGLVVPGQPTWWVVLYKLSTEKQDADAPKKLVHDAIMDALGTDDTWLGVPIGGKKFSKRSEQHLELWLKVYPVADKEHFNLLTDAFLDEVLSVLHVFKG